MNRRALLVALPIVMTICCGSLPPAAAQSIYTCRDHAGRTQTSDRPLSDCAGVMRELGPSGILKREIAPPLTADQQRLKDIEDRAKRVADEVAREKRRRDLALLAAYQSEDQIEAARRRSLADADESIRMSRTRLDELQKEKKALTLEADVYAGKPMPPLFRRRLDDNRALIDDEEASMKIRQADVERVNLRYDDDRNRYRELVGQGK
ncbi:MAG: DUF4124 domain-containing protein [Burkholderiaceae bacterium]